MIKSQRFLCRVLTVGGTGSQGTDKEGGKLGIHQGTNYIYIKRVFILLYLPMFTLGVQLHSHIDRWKEYCSKNILFKKISIVSMPGDFVAVGYLQAQRGRRLHCHGRNSSGRSSSIKNNIALVVLVHESRTKMLFILYRVECLDNNRICFLFLLLFLYVNFFHTVPTYIFRAISIINHWSFTIVFILSLLYMY